MFLEPIFSIQQKYNRGVLPKILNKSKKREHIISRIQERATDEDFLALYIIALNRKVFDPDLVSVNDFKLNAVSEIINIMNKGEGDTSFQNEVINYLMQVKDKDFLIYVLDNILKKHDSFPIKNIQVFISTLSMSFKSSKLDNRQKRKLMNVIYKHFPSTAIEVQETLIRMMEILKIVEIYKTAELFADAEATVKKRLIDAIKASITIKKASEIINDINTIQPDGNIDDKYALLFIIAIEKYKLHESITTIMELKERKVAWEDILRKLNELMGANLIDQNKFLELLEISQ